MIHVAVENPRKGEQEEIEDALRQITDDEIVITDASVKLADVPKLDDYADELAERVADKLEDR